MEGYAMKYRLLGENLQDHKKSKGNETAGAGRPNRYQYAEPVQD